MVETSVGEHRALRVPERGISSKKRYILIYFFNYFFIDSRGRATAPGFARRCVAMSRGSESHSLRTGFVREQERAAALAEAKQDAQSRTGLLPQHGNSRTYNINTLLFDNIMSNDYFHGLIKLHAFEQVMDEIDTSVRTAAPWAPGGGRRPSVMFCVLVKLCVLYV
tara:strand:+ start:463 stop:960 length:498 start_codon:yes stop_codon:yes gene_type:complete